ASRATAPRPTRSRATRPVPRSGGRCRRRVSSRAHELALRADAVHELLEGVDELLDALLLEDPDDVVVVDARRGEIVEKPVGLVESRLERGGDLAVVLEGLDRLLRHRVHRVGPD